MRFGNVLVKLLDGEVIEFVIDVLFVIWNIIFGFLYLLRRFLLILLDKLDNELLWIVFFML